MKSMWQIGLAVAAFVGMTAIGIAQPGPGGPGGPGGGFPGGPGKDFFKKAFEAKKGGGGDLAAEVKALEAKINQLSDQIDSLNKSIAKGKPGSEPRAAIEKKFSPEMRKEFEKKMTERFGDRFTPEMKKKFEERFGPEKKPMEARGPQGKGPEGKGPPGFGRGFEGRGGPPMARGPEPKGPPSRTATDRGPGDIDSRLAQIERLIEEIRRDLRQPRPGQPGPGPRR